MKEEGKKIKKCMKDKGGGSEVVRGCKNICMYRITVDG
jgi:hypothetical protein